MQRHFTTMVLFLGCAWATAADRGVPTTHERITPKFCEAEATVPGDFRMCADPFVCSKTQKLMLKHSGVEVLTVQFPSEVTTKVEENNTVVAEYYRPVNAKARPAVIVLDILDGAQVVSRAQALWLAQHDIPAVIVYMAYYGPRRPAGSKVRLLSPDVAQSIANIKQTVLDCRRAVAWLEEQPEVDPKRIGLLGTSLGSFIGAIVSANEPKITRVSLLLGGGDLVQSFSEHPKAKPILTALSLAGISLESLKKQIAVVDPITYASTLKAKKLLLIGASRDDVVPPQAMRRLWEATDKPKLIWIDETHVGAALYMFQMMREVTDFMNASK
jgi:dienelactone hydrolase